MKFNVSEIIYFLYICYFLLKIHEFKCPSIGDWPEIHEILNPRK